MGDSIIYCKDWEKNKPAKSKPKASIRQKAKGCRRPSSYSALGEPMRGLENEAVVAYPSIVRASKNTFGGLACHVCGNKDRSCPNCGGPGTPWLI